MIHPAKKIQHFLAANVLLGFPLLYLGWGYLFWSPLFAVEESVWSFPSIIFFELQKRLSTSLAGLINYHVKEVSEISSCIHSQYRQAVIRYRS